MGERERLVLVDDEPVILNLLASVLDGEDYDVVPCADGRTALFEIDKGCDVLLTDKNLPDVNGLDLLKRARERHPDCEGIIITGYASLDTALAAMQLDAFDYIVKPPKDIFEVRRKVRQAFDRVRMRRENQRLLRRLEVQNQELQTALDQLRDAQDELIQSEKLAGIGTLAAGIAHEVASPLFGVLGLAEAILLEDDPELVRGYAREIVDYAKTIREIVTQLSGYSRSAEREGHTTVDLLRVVEDAVRLVVRSVGFDPARVQVRGPADLYLNARTTEIAQVFVNLVKNAVEAVTEQHLGEGGAVDITLGRADDVIWATVSDNGIGIPADRVHAIFDPFFTTKPPGRGTGLGLNIVYRIVTKYRGQVAVESEAGRGTQITVRFPCGGSVQP